MVRGLLRFRRRGRQGGGPGCARSRRRPWRRRGSGGELREPGGARHAPQPDVAGAGGGVHRRGRLGDGADAFGDAPPDGRRHRQDEGERAAAVVHRHDGAEGRGRGGRRRGPGRSGRLRRRGRLRPAADGGARGLGPGVGMGVVDQGGISLWVVRCVRRASRARLRRCSWWNSSARARRARVLHRLEAVMAFRSHLGRRP
mmetsp:Transcript_90352/g.252533  ORF Transcript_90352/g.252533 Transcript_90352/m.252533 type:complete len:200 (-) Transcript_90352:23-622(-)